MKAKAKPAPKPVKKAALKAKPVVKKAKPAAKPAAKAVKAKAPAKPAAKAPKAAPKKVAVKAKAPVKAVAPKKAVAKPLTPAAPAKPQPAAKPVTKPQTQPAMKTAPKIPAAAHPAPAHKAHAETKPAETKVVRYSDADLSIFKDVILKKIAKAKEEIDFYTDQIRNSSESETQFASIDDGSMTSERENMNQIVVRMQKLISHLESALVRIENKSYGICRETGRLIPKERLMVVPHATLSVEGKKLEKK